MGQWRRWGEATPALGVLEAPFCILPRRCRPMLARVGLQGGARAHQEQPVDDYVPAITQQGEKLLIARMMTCHICSSHICRVLMELTDLL